MSLDTRIENISNDSAICVDIRNHEIFPVIRDKCIHSVITALRVGQGYSFDFRPCPIRCDDLE